MSDYSCNDSTESPASSTYRGPASPTLVDMPLEEFPPPQPAVFSPHPRLPRLVTPTPHAPVPARGNPTVTNHLLTLGWMSPRSVCSAIATHALKPNTYQSIINGLIVTSEACTHHFQQELATKEEGHKKKLDDLNETVEFLEACLIGYINTFSQPPDGYIENGCLPTFTIPCGNGLSNPAKWVKKLDDGQVAGYSAEDSPHDLPHICKIYASPSIQLTLQSLYPIGSTKPFKGQPLATLPSLMQSRLRTTGDLRLTSCISGPSTSASSPTRPNSTALMVSSKVPLSPKTSAEEGWNVRNFLSRFRISKVL